MKKPVLDPLGDEKRDPLRPYTVADLCKVTGWSRPTIYAAIESGQLPGYQSGPKGKWFVPAQAFRDLCAGRWQPPVREITIHALPSMVHHINQKAS